MTAHTGAGGARFATAGPPPTDPNRSQKLTQQSTHPPTLCGNCQQQPAARTYVTEDGTLFPLCETCSEAFALGQANSDADMWEGTAIATCAGCGEVIDLDEDTYTQENDDYYCEGCSDDLDGDDLDGDDSNNTYGAHIEGEDAPGGYTLEMQYEDRVSAGYEPENY